MIDQHPLERITVHPAIMAGKPVIAGTRLTVDYILNLLAHGATLQEILDEYDGLIVTDIQACLLFATKHLIGYFVVTTEKRIRFSKQSL